MDGSGTSRLDPFAHDWGHITPDWIKDNVAIHIVTHEVGTPNGIDRTVRFVSARIALFERHLPSGMKQGVIIDDRGQELPPHAREHLRNGLPHRLAFVKFFTEGL
jgi:hypothetical protein